MSSSDKCWKIEEKTTFDIKKSTWTASIEAENGGAANGHLIFVQLAS
jgi:hypothetical protein